MVAQAAPLDELPVLNDEQKTVAAKLGVASDAYARNLLALNWERADLEEKSARAARLVERLARARVPGLQVTSVWLNTFDEKFRFELEHEGRQNFVFISEKIIDELAEGESESAEGQISRILVSRFPLAGLLKLPRESLWGDGNGFGHGRRKSCP
jgi:hypothetical protein